MSTLLLSDLHLPPSPSPLRAAFLAFLQGPARSASAVYLLGDLFEYWIGDASGRQRYADETAALRRLADAGVRLWFQHGNRDFLVAQDFARRTGLHLMRDPAVVDIEGERTLLSHGDLFCTDDAGYQRWRRFSRNRAAQAVFLRLPQGLRERIAGGLRSGSGAAKRHKPESIMDVNEAAVREAFRRYGVQRIVHGHTHRPAVHVYDVDGRRCERIVLSDWHDERREYLEVSASGWNRIAL